MSGIRPPDCPKLAKNLKNDNDVIIFWHGVNVNFFDVVLFLLSSLVTGPSFMSISSLVLELWQFSFIRDWPEIRKSEIPPSEFCPISGDWGELWIPNLARMSLIECYGMLQNARITAFIVLELLRKNQLGRGGLPPHPYRLGLRGTHSTAINFYIVFHLTMYFANWHDRTLLETCYYFLKTKCVYKKSLVVLHFMWSFVGFSQRVCWACR